MTRAPPHTILITAYTLPRAALRVCALAMHNASPLTEVMIQGRGVLLLCVR
jgi:hypothetical protein